MEEQNPNGQIAELEKAGCHCRDPTIGARQQPPVCIEGKGAPIRMNKRSVARVARCVVVVGDLRNRVRRRIDADDR